MDWENSFSDIEWMSVSGYLPKKMVNGLGKAIDIRKLSVRRSSAFSIRVTLWTQSTKNIFLVNSDKKRFKMAVNFSCVSLWKRIVHVFILSGNKC